jgi:phosphoribosylformimino-5-aminoimidazole carboxamide ribotide isomerase
VQLGGGLRSLGSLERALALGVDRVVLGTAALRDAGLVREAAARFPGRVVLGLDARDGRVAVEGWLEVSETTALELARRFADAGIAAIVHTDVSRDGVMAGPNLEASAALAEDSGLPVIASGGVRSEDDVMRAAALAPRGVVGAIVGRALYTGDLDLRSALRRLACC